MTPLVHAAAAGHLQTAELLLARGADPKDNAGGTPLSWAVEYKHSDIINLLRAKGVTE